MSDLDILKEIPGYKAILKSVLKSQIHLLMEQLSEHTGEESIILTASVHDGSLSHLGSNTGKGFLEGRDEIKSQFLGYCLKTYHKKKTHEPQKPYQRTHPSPRAPAQVPNPPAKRSRLQPPSLPRLSPVETSSPLSHMPSETSDSNIGFVISGAVEESIMSIKSEQSDNQGVDLPEHTEANDSVMFSRGEKTVPDSVHLSHTQTSGAAVESGAEIDNVVESVDTENSNASEISSIKVEQVEDELEITGVEMAAGSLENWGQGQGQPGYGLEADSSLDQSADQSGYKTVLSEGTEGEEKIVSLTKGTKPLHSVTGHHFENLMAGLSSTQGVSWTGSSAADIPTSALGSSKDLESYVSKGYRHLLDAASVKKVLPGQEHTCETCGKVYYHRQHLMRHRSVHTGERMFKCSLCPKDFRLKHHLKEHLILVHKKTPSNVAPFIFRKK